MNSDTKQTAQSQTKKIKTEEFAAKNGWKFAFTSGGILPSNDLENVSKKLKLNNICDVVFGFNQALLINEQHDFVYAVNPQDSLAYCNFETRQNRLIEPYEKTKEVNHINVIPTEVKVKLNEKWKNKHIDPEVQSEIKTLQQISDCFYSSGYKGTIIQFSLPPDQKQDIIQKEFQRKINEEQVQHSFISENTTMEIPLANLGQENPIRWSNMIHLWEDELGDSGQTMSEFRFRTMDNCFFGLLRHYLRVDDVLLRIYDTRIYHEYGQNYILREFSVREDSYENIANKGFKFTAKWMIDEGQSHLVSNYVEQKQINRDKIYFNKN